MSSTANRSFPTIGLPVPPGRNHIASKAKSAWKYVYANYLNQAEFFLKADPDTYIVIENLRQYLKKENADTAQYYGHRYYQPGWK